ncbi:hypothetical protein ACHAWF_006463, partial [Thalassiosira exigua]
MIDSKNRSLGTPSSATSSQRSLRLSSLTSTGPNMTDGKARDTNCLSNERVNALRLMLGHPAWRAITVIFTLVVVFVPLVRDIWLPKNADASLDGIFTIAFFELMIDIVIRAIVDKSYFVWNCGGCSWPNCFGVGSFFFWTDAVSLMTTVAELSYINPTRSEMISLTVYVNELGLPKAGASPTPLGLKWELMLTFARVGLMARFMPILVDLTKSFHNMGHSFAQTQCRPKQFSEVSESPALEDIKPEDSLSSSSSKDLGSRVGTAMVDLTGQRVVIGVLLALFITSVCNWPEPDTTKVLTMIMLHGQTANAKFASLSVDAARSKVIPSLFRYRRANDAGNLFMGTYSLGHGDAIDLLRDREILGVHVFQKGSDESSLGLFDNKEFSRDNAKVYLVTQFLILLLWTLGVASYSGIIKTLVLQPIERMVTLLRMLTNDPLLKLAYEEEDGMTDSTLWAKEVLKGMETTFLLSTIQRIGSLMQVGFGSAGVEIIRDNFLERGGHTTRKDELLLRNKEGSSVSCVFLFCDIRQFTDATECLQEEVFVFTNKIASVIHTICHSYGGSANKNIGDAFLVSWQLDEVPTKKEDDESDLTSDNPGFYASANQADKALLSVVHISMALHYDEYYLDGMNQTARERLQRTLSQRQGPIVQMGFGLHAGKAVSGALGSNLKLDATFVSEEVDRAEFLEGLTKQYEVPLLMSDTFHQLLSKSTQLRCRKVDRLIVLTADDEGLDPYELLDSGGKMSVYTFDMDIDALWRQPADDKHSITSTADGGQQQAIGSSFKKIHGPFPASKPSVPARRSPTRRTSLLLPVKEIPRDIENVLSTDDSGERPARRTLVLPTGACHQYEEKAWLNPDIKSIRKAYVSNGIIFPKFTEGLNAYYAKDWVHAKRCFEFIMTQLRDGPSLHFLKLMEEHN